MRVKVRSTPVAQFSFEEITEVIGRFANNARRVGILVAFKEIVKIACDDVLRLIVQLVLDGYNPDHIRDILDRQIQSRVQHHETRYRMMLGGALLIRTAEHPRIVEQNLRTFFVPGRGERGTYTEASVSDLEARLQETSFTQLGCDEIVEVLTDMSIIARAEQVTALEEIVDCVDEKLLVQGPRLAIEGRDPEWIRNIQERRIQSLLHHHRTQYGMVCEGMLSIQNGEPPQIIEQKVRSFYE